MTSSAPAGTSTGRTRAFRFGEPEAVLDRRDMISYAECGLNGRWYEPPIPPKGLARAYRATAHHSSALQYKRDQLVRHFKPSRLLDRRNFADFALNYLTMGNGYLERRDSISGRPLKLVHSPAIHTRRGKDEGEFYWVPGYRNEVPFAPGSVFQLYETDLEQEIYGVPEYLAALQSAFLNEQSTLFRRRYFQNGAHAGFVFYLNEATMSDEDADDIEEALEGAKGVGNFKNLFIHAPGGKKDGVQIIPIGEAAAKDEFLGIKQATTEDVLASHRVPPILLGFVPHNAGGLGSIIDAANAFHINVATPIMMRMMEINDWLGEEAIAFEAFQPMAKTGAPL
ncbi:phage portal protein, PBSX family [Sphingomonas sp. OK281]|nr:phage portal protein, PBSX family [Sphingomonas sp. OK281]